MASKIKSSDINDIVQKYRSGLSAQNIGGEYGVSVPTITTILKSNGIAIRGNKRKLPSKEICKSYQAGESARSISRRFTVTDKVIRRILVQSGVSLRGIEYRMIDLPENKILELYKDGIGAQGIAIKFGCSRQPILRILKKHNVTLRNRSWQQQARMDRSSPSVISKLTQAAHKASKGRICTEEERCKVALSREKNAPQSLFSPYETILRQMLLDRGISTIPQKAIGRYNCDLACYPVAVEIFGGQWHWYGLHIRRSERRFKYILNRGWNILAVNINKRRFPLTFAVADYIATHVKSISSNPPLVCQYRMVWGAGEFSTGGSLDDDHFSIEPPFTCRHNPTTGRYETVARQA